MNIMWKNFLVGGLALLVVGAGSSVLAAPIWLTEDEGVIAVDSILNDDSYIAGGRITVSRDVRGDLFVFGGTVRIEANIQDDLFVFGGEVLVNGNVGDDMRVIAGNVKLSGDVADDLLIAGGELEMGDTARIGGDLHFGGGEADIAGAVAGNLRAGFGTGNFNATVGGDAEFTYAEEIRVGEEARIAGVVSYRATEANAALEAVASEAKFTKVEPSGLSAAGLAALLTLAGILALLWKWLVCIFVGAIIIWVLPKYFPKVIDAARARKNIGSAMWAGLIILIGVPFVNLMLMLTVIGIPVAIVLGLGYLILIMFGAIVGAYWIGSTIRRHQHRNEWEQLGNLALGVLILLIITVIPVIGWIASLAVVLIGIGSIWFEKVRLVKEYRD